MEVGDAFGAASEGSKMKPVELQFEVETKKVRAENEVVGRCN